MNFDDPLSPVMHFYKVNQKDMMTVNGRAHFHHSWITDSSNINATAAERLSPLVAQQFDSLQIFIDVLMPWPVSPSDQSALPQNSICHHSS